MFKKIVIADSLAWRVDYCFENYHSLDGGVLLLGIIYFSIQLYCDFSGYSDIAIGSGKILGFDLMPNFNYPFFLLLFLNFGGDGIFHFLAGSVTIFLSHYQLSLEIMAE